MISTPKKLAPILVILALIVLGTEATISCNTVMNDLMPCVTYLMFGNGKPSGSCCAGVSALASAVPTAADKKAACNCIQSASRGINVNAQLAKDLPKNCGIALPFTVSPNVDCSTIG